MKKFIKKILAKLNLLEKIQYNPLYRLNRDPDFKKEYKKQLALYTEILGKKNNLIFDIGANVGDYASMFKKLASKIIVLEPDEQNFRILNVRFSKNKNIIVIKKAVASSIGEAELYIESSGSAFNTLSVKWVEALENQGHLRFNENKKFAGSQKIATTTLDFLLEEYGVPDFVKIDVEGFELEVIKGLSKPIPLLSFECNFPEFKEETLKIIRHLTELSNGYLFNYIREYDFILPGFINADEMIKIIETTNFRYFEIFCKLSK